MPTIQVHGAVILSGSWSNLDAAKKELRRHYACHHYRDHAMKVEDVAEREMGNLQRIADQHQLRIEQTHGTHEVHLAEPEAKSIKLNLIAGGWYRTDEPSFPLVHVTHIWSHFVDGEELWLFDVDLVDSKALPMPVTIDARQLKSYNPKPATREDFEELDITPPDGFEPSPHSIPEPEEKTAGTSLPKAHIARSALMQRLGTGLRSAKVVRAQRGFLVEADVIPGLHGLPEEIDGTPVRYK